MFVGLSPVHASDVPLVLNLTSGEITAQFHVVFDDLFTTVSSIGWEDEQPPDHWEQLCLDNSSFTLVDSPPKFLQDDWLNAEEKEQKHCALKQETRIRSTIQEPVTIKKFKLMESSEDTSIESTDTNTIPVQAGQVGKIETIPVQAGQVVKIEKEISAIIEVTKETVTDSARKHEENISVSEGMKKKTIAISPRRSVRSTGGNFQSKQYMDEVFLIKIHDYSMSASFILSRDTNRYGMWRTLFFRSKNICNKAK